MADALQEWKPWRRVIIADGLRYDLLAELAVNAGRVVPHEELLHRMWGGPTPPAPSGPHPLMRLRQKLGEDGENHIHVFAEPRAGYRMAESERVG